jgi:hypothetical protein
MNKFALPLTTLAATALLAGCAQSASTTASTSPTASTSTTSPTGSPASAPASTPATSAPATSAPVTPAPSAATALIPSGATTATLVYDGPLAAKRLHATKTVTGATYQRLTEDLNALKPVSGVAQCMVLTGETALVTIKSSGHTAVFTIAGSPCRGVTVTEDGVPMPRLNSTMTLLNQVRAIAGFTGLAHPLTG